MNKAVVSKLDPDGGSSHEQFYVWDEPFQCADDAPDLM